MLLTVESPKLNSIIVDSYEFVRVSIVEFDVLASLRGLSRSRLQAFTLALLHTPHNNEISICFAT